MYKNIFIINKYTYMCGMDDFVFYCHGLLSMARCAVATPYTCS